MRCDRPVQSIRDIPFVGRNPALDFVNTAEERGHPQAGDALTSAADLRVWGVRYGLIARSGVRAALAEAEFEKAREARELLYTLFFGRVHHTPAPKAALTRLAQLGAEAYRAASLEMGHEGSLRWRWSRSELATVRHVAVTSAIELLGAPASPRLKQCPGPHCGWFFLDSTKRGNRRWCSMDDCGQEAKNLSRRKASSERR